MPAADNIRQQMRKGLLEFCLLLLLERKHEAYAQEIVQELKDADMIVVEGSLYPALMRLKNSGCLEYKWVESKQGPPRKYYSITETGKDLLKEHQAAWNEMRNAVEKLSTCTTNH